MTITDVRYKEHNTNYVTWSSIVHILPQVLQGNCILSMRLVGHVASMRNQ